MSTSTTYLEEGAQGASLIPIECKLLTQRKIFLEGAIDSEAAIRFTKQMMHLAESDAPIDIYINSHGGEVDAGLVIYDLIQGFRGELRMYCFEHASSMAAVLLAAGQKGRRFILPHSSVMIHEVLVRGGISGSATSISKVSASVMKTRDLMNAILAEHTGKSIEEINEATTFDNIMNAEEAVAFGICDAIVDSIAGKGSAA